jgi:hypothetical protein
MQVKASHPPRRGIHIPPVRHFAAEYIPKKEPLALTLFTLTMGGAIFGVFNVRTTLHEYIVRSGSILPQMCRWISIDPIA